MRGPLGSKGAITLFLALAACGGEIADPGLPTLETILAAGDIADCNTPHEATADLLDSLEGVVLTLGDNAYESGTLQEFLDCYDPSWGRHLDRTRPVAGNHDYGTPAAAGYFDYFGSRAGNPGEVATSGACCTTRGWTSF